MITTENAREYAFLICSKQPELLPALIDGATKGVQAYAESQQDTTAKIAFAMSQVLDECPQKSFGPFNRKDILDLMTPLEGTTWMNRQRESLSLTPE